MATTTLKQARRAVARSLSDMSVYLVSGSSSTTVFSTQLVDDTPDASEHRYDGAHVYTGDIFAQQRRIQTEGYAPSTGTLTVQTDWLSPPVAGNELEITRQLPSVSTAPSDDTSYTACIERALAKILVPDRITIAITTAETYSLASYPWLDRDERLLRMLEPAITGTRTVDASWRRPRLVWSSGTPTLELDAPFDLGTGSLTLEVLRPADTFLGGAETAPGVGFAADAQTCLVGIEDLVPVALMECLYTLMSRSPGRPGQWDARYAEAKARAEALFHFDGSYFKPRPPQAPAAAVA